MTEGSFHDGKMTGNKGRRIEQDLYQQYCRSVF